MAFRTAGMFTRPIMVNLTTGARTIVSLQKKVFPRQQCSYILRPLTSGMQSQGTTCFPSSLTTKCFSTDILAITTEYCLDNRATKAPSREQATDMPRAYSEMSNDLLMKLSHNGSFGASEELLKREIMVVDNLSWEETSDGVLKVQAACHQNSFLFSLPYKFGIVGGMGLALATIPLCFDYNTAMWFNENYVTTEIPPPEDLETMLEVGAWTWNWMEPPIGQVSFFLLCLQFIRSTMLNISLKPYNEFVKQRRIERVLQAFPQYSELILKQYATNERLR